MANTTLHTVLKTVFLLEYRHLTGGGGGFGFVLSLPHSSIPQPFSEKGELSPKTPTGCNATCHIVSLGEFTR